VSDDGSEDWPGAWTFKCSTVDLDGIEVEVRITVPRRATWRSSGDLPPVTALGAVAQATADDAMKSIADIKGRPPF
jgi:hypothetical protein